MVPVNSTRSILPSDFQKSLLLGGLVPVSCSLVMSDCCLHGSSSTYLSGVGERLLHLVFSWVYVYVFVYPCPAAYSALPAASAVEVSSSQVALGQFVLH